MEDKSINKIGNYFLALVGIAMLTYAIYSLVTGYSHGFQFHVWNVQLSGIEALIVNIAYSFLCLVLVFTGLRGIFNANKTKT